MKREFGIFHSSMFDGKIVLVTGGGRGIGRAISLKFARSGAVVLINYLRNRQAAEETEREIRAGGGECRLYQANLCNPEEINKMMSRLAEDHGKLDILIHNAALGVFKPTLQIRANQWDLSLNVNARSLLMMARHCPGLMREGGKIIGISSLGSTRVLPNYGVIGVSKAALESLVRYLAVEMAPLGIIVNGISGGFIETESIRQFPDYEKTMSLVLERIPARRLGTPEDIANAAVLLAGDEASWIHGHILVVDGGWSLL